MPHGAEWADNSENQDRSNDWMKPHDAAGTPVRDRLRDDELSAPAGFKSDTFYLDKGLRRGFPLPRRVLSTEWTQPKQLAGL